MCELGCNFEQSTSVCLFVFYICIRVVPMSKQPVMKAHMYMWVWGKF
jgi:hypothetical protein